MMTNFTENILYKILYDTYMGGLFRINSNFSYIKFPFTQIYDFVLSAVRCLCYYYCARLYFEELLRAHLSRRYQRFLA